MYKNIFWTFTVLLLEVDAKKILKESPFPRYPNGMRWPVRANDLRSQSKENKYGLAWERSGLFEGDILLSPNETRNALASPAKKWSMPVPVFINTTDFDVSELAVIEKALTEIELKTCVRFRQYQLDDPSFIVVRGNDKGCWSVVGRKDGGQVLHLQRPACVNHGVVIHEFLHALGLHHQQSSPDRDDYVQIHWHNIKIGRENNFSKYGTSTVTTYNLTYDYSSVMHYSEKAFSVNGEPTITPVDPSAKIGQRKRMSEIDAMKIKIMYDCPPMVDLPDKEPETESEYFNYDLDIFD